jgi:hypothetical protein
MPPAQAIASVPLESRYCAPLFRRRLSSLGLEGDPNRYPEVNRKLFRRGLVFLIIPQRRIRLGLGAEIPLSE